VSFKPTEYTVRQLLIEELKRRGVKVTPEISFVSPVGRLVPDLLLQNGGNYWLRQARRRVIFTFILMILHIWISVLVNFGSWGLDRIDESRPPVYAYPHYGI